MRFADIRTEWRVDKIETDLSRKAESYEISSLRSDVDNLERANRRLSDSLDELRNWLQRTQEEIIALRSEHEN